MKHILITGSTDGIGKRTAFMLAEQGHQLYLHGRNESKLHATIKEIKQKTGNENITSIRGDFSEIKSVRQFAANAVQGIDKLDILINNAGVFNTSQKQNNEGLDFRMMVNFFAPIIVTRALLPKLRESDDPRVINLSSAAQAPVRTEVLIGTETTRDDSAYAQSKLALTMWSFQLAEQNPDLCVIAVNPGSLLNTKMVQEAFGQSWDSVDKGASIITKLATEIAYRQDTGKYFDNDQGAFGTAHPDAYNRGKTKELMESVKSILN